jgi:hypothetical protein
MRIHTESNSGSAFLMLFCGECQCSIVCAHCTPYSAMVSFDLTNDGNSNNDRTPGLGRNSFDVPATVSLDSRITKNLIVREKVRLQFIGEAFNVLNNGNVTAVRSTQFVGSSDTAVCGIAGTPCLVPQNSGLNAFGVPTATSGARIAQLSARLTF